VAKDFYETLGVSRSASEKEIRSAYRRLARKLHPDVNPNDSASEARFKEVNAAHDVLSDPDKRKKYDKYGDNWEHADEFDRAQRARAGNARTRYFYGNGPGGGVQFEGDFSDLGEIGQMFGGMFGGRGGGGRRQQARRQDLTLEQGVDISLEEAFKGTARLLSAEVDGAGPRRIEVKIPAGVTNGSRVRVAGEGRMGFDGQRGDLYLVVSVQPHPRFERKGDDLYVDVEAPLTMAVLGGEVEVQGMDKKVALKLPALTQNGRTFRLGGLGMPKLNGGGARGDLYARIKARLPEELGDKEKQLFEELKAAGI
jgi:DnaJ-class molecular chaperone